MRHSRPMHTEIGPGVIQIDTLLGGWHNVTAGYLIQGREPIQVGFAPTAPQSPLPSEVPNGVR